MTTVNLITTIVTNITMGTFTIVVTTTVIRTTTAPAARAAMTTGTITATNMPA